jgi:4-aminobutyrate aminotransferase-like enzyme
MGLKFPIAGAGMPATKMLVDHGLFALYANNDKSVVQLLPPLIISDEDADEIIGVLRRVLG